MWWKRRSDACAPKQVEEVKSGELDEIETVYHYYYYYYYYYYYHHYYYYLLVTALPHTDLGIKLSHAPVYRGVRGWWWVSGETRRMGEGVTWGVRLLCNSTNDCLLLYYSNHRSHTIVALVSRYPATTTTDVTNTATATATVMALPLPL